MRYVGAPSARRSTDLTSFTAWYAALPINMPCVHAYQRMCEVSLVVISRRKVALGRSVDVDLKRNPVFDLLMEYLHDQRETRLPLAVDALRDSSSPHHTVHIESFLSPSSVYPRETYPVRRLSSSLSRFFVTSSLPLVNLDI